MHRQLDARATAQAVAIATLVLATACHDLLAPGAANTTAPPGRLLIAGNSFTEWQWTPGGREILYTSPGYSDFGTAPVSLLAIDATTGATRTVLPVLGGSLRLSPWQFAAQGTHVYFVVVNMSDGTNWLASTPLSPSDTAATQPSMQLLMQVQPFTAEERPDLPISVSPDERTLAWLGPVPGANFGLNTLDIYTREARSYPIAGEMWMRHIVWSPSGRTIVTEANDGLASGGQPYYVVDRTSGAVRAWSAPKGDFDDLSPDHIAWSGEEPVLYVAGRSVLQYHMLTGARQVLASLAAPATAAAWSSDVQTVFVAHNDCQQVSTGPFGGNCLAWSSSIERVALSTGARATVAQNRGADMLGARLSPGGNVLAYEYHPCGHGCYTAHDGLWVMAAN